MGKIKALLPLIYIAAASCAVAATRVELIRNEKVAVYDEKIGPAETELPGNGHPSVTVYVTDGTLGAGVAVKRGDAVYRGPKDGAIGNTGSYEIHLVRIELLGTESAETWGNAGLPPNYRVLIENGYARVYDISMPAGGSEPQHSHHDRIVIGLSEAQLKHILPDGQVVDSTLKTGEVAWRRGQTHIGENVGKTDLWAIAVEPK